jgi:hypothetical protein
METNVVPQGQPVWGIGTLPGEQVIPPHPTSLCPYRHDDLLPKNLPLRGRCGVADGPLWQPGLLTSFHLVVILSTACYNKGKVESELTTHLCHNN